MSSKQLWAALLALTLIIAACGGDDGGSDATSPSSDQTSGGSNSDDGGDGDESTPGGGGFTGDDARADATGAGEDFPIPIPGGWEIDGLAVLEEQGASFSGGVQLYYAQEDFDELIAFYDEWTAAQPDEYSRNEANGNVVYSKASPLAQITISKDFENQGGLWTFLVISAASE